MLPKIILIYPPVTKCSEPPAGIAKLSACLHAHQVPHNVIDANLEGILFLLQQVSSDPGTTDHWTKRAVKHWNQNLMALRDMTTYQNPSRYDRAVMDINRLLNLAGKAHKIKLSLADYQDERLSPLRSVDLISAAENPQTNPFYFYFQNRLSIVLRANPDFVGFSLNYLSQALSTFAMIGYIKRIHPRQKIILGGSLVTSWMKLGVDKNMFGGLVDDIVEGAGEQKLLRILGLPDQPISFPPAYDDFPWEHYFSPGLILPYSGASGCYWHQCAFCPEKAEDNPYKPVASFQMTQDLQTLTSRLNPALIHILDSSISPAQLMALAQDPPGAPWYGFTRVTEDLANEDFCLSLKNSGCKMLKLGIESGDQSVLDQLNKGIDLSTTSSVLKKLKKAGIATYCYFLLGTPPENEKNALKTMNFVVKHNDCIDFLNVAIFNLPARSVEAQSMATHDFYEGDLSLYRNFKHPLDWHRGKVRIFSEKTFKRHPIIAQILRKTPTFFTSNHAPFFIFEKNRHDRDSLTKCR